jgi:hypothetical protein
LECRLVAEGVTGTRSITNTPGQDPERSRSKPAAANSYFSGIVEVNAPSVVVLPFT